MLDWINRRLNTSLQDVDIQSIRDFSLMWNLYERTTCETSYNYNKMEKLIEKSNLNIQDFQIFLDYFKDRYVENGQLNTKFDFLRLRNGDNRQLVTDVLLGNNSNSKDIILVCSTIVYRFRNNLFHGIKDVAQINHQRTNFETSNKFMQKFLETVFPV